MKIIILTFFIFLFGCDDPNGPNIIRTVNLKGSPSHEIKLEQKLEFKKIGDYEIRLAGSATGNLGVFVFDNKDTIFIMEGSNDNHPVSIQIKNNFYITN